MNGSTEKVELIFAPGQALASLNLSTSTPMGLVGGLAAVTHQPFLAVVADMPNGKWRARVLAEIQAATYEDIEEGKLIR